MVTDALESALAKTIESLASFNGYSQDHIDELFTSLRDVKNYLQDRDDLPKRLALILAELYPSLTDVAQRCYGSDDAMPIRQAAAELQMEVVSILGANGDQNAETCRTHR